MKLRADVERLPAYEEHDAVFGLDLYDPLGVYRAAVLALIDAQVQEAAEALPYRASAPTADDERHAGHEVPVAGCRLCRGARA